MIGDRFSGSEMAFHQTFLNLGRTSKSTFSGTPTPDSDFIVSFGSLPADTPDWYQSYPIHRKVAILPENPIIYFPDNKYLEHIGHLIAPAVPMSWNQREKFIPSHGAVPWFYGVPFQTNVGLTHVRNELKPKELNFHAERPYPRKEKLLSMVTSTKSWLPGHSFRIELGSQLKAKLGDQIDLFGFGHNPISDKSAALDPYLYTIVVENYFIPNYFTEKLCDAYLGFSAPIYIGAPNIQSFFDAPVLNAGTESVEQAVTTILRLIDKPVDIDAVLRNRWQVMFQHNLFYHLERILTRM